MNRNSMSRLAITSILGLALSYGFVFLAALPIRYLRLTFGRRTFLSVTALSSAAIVAWGQWQWALVYSSLCLLVGVYRELEIRKHSIFSSAALAMASTFGLVGLILLAYSNLSLDTFGTLLTTKVAPMMEQLKQIPRFKEASVENVLWFLPAGTFVTMMMVVFISLTINRPMNHLQKRFELRMFKLPDWFIWVFIGSLAATFVKTSTPLLSVVGMNVLVVSLASYFFQGLAVFTFYLDKFSIFGFWRMLAYFFVFFQMFIFISGLGILDYWFEFRLQGLTDLQNKNSKNFKRSTK